MQGMNDLNDHNSNPITISQAAPAVGYYRGQTLAAIRDVVDSTRPFGGWRGQSYHEDNTGNTAIGIFLAVVLFVCLVFIGQEEGFVWAVAIVSMAIGLFGSYLLLEGMGWANDISCQVIPDKLSGLPGNRDFKSRIRHPATRSKYY